MTGEPATPRPAATLILLRRGGRHHDRGLEVLMVRRSERASFMPGAWVFPGGAIDPGEDAAACAARELAEETGIELPEGEELIPWARWITPEPVPVRFDTHFLVALAPAHAPPRPDGAEISEARWIGPGAVLTLAADGEIEVAFPTVKTLESLQGHARAEDVIAAARKRAARGIEPILPRVVGTRESFRILLPGDPGYE